MSAESVGASTSASRLTAVFVTDVELAMETLGSRLAEIGADILLAKPLDSAAIETRNQY